MLSKQPWMKLQCEMKTEWQQCWDEGLDVAVYRQACADLAQSSQDREEEAVGLAAEMHARPLRPDFGYVERSTLEEIMAGSAAGHVVSKPVPPDDILRDKVCGAWTGRIFGCLLGKPVEGWRRDKLLPLLKATDNYPMHKYIAKKDFSDALVEQLGIDVHHFWRDNIVTVCPADDDTNYTVFAMKLLETYGMDFTPDDVLEGWLRWIPVFQTCTAERVAYRNALLGLLSPQTAVRANPYREWIGAQIRGDFFGYISPGNPKKAATYAFRDASISHIKNGIYGEMWVAAMIAAAAVCDDIIDIIENGLAVIEQNCRLAEDIRKIMELYAQKAEAQDVIEFIHKKYDEKSEHHWCHTCSNAMIVTMALLYGKRDYAKSICLAVQSAFDTDCNGATVGSVLGMLLGRKGISDDWAFTDQLQTGIDGYNIVTISELTEKTMRFIQK